MISRFGPLSWIILVSYLTVTVGVGVWFSRREKTPRDFFLASHRIPWWASGLSIFATQLSAITYLGIPARAYGTDWTFFLINGGILAIVPLVTHYYIPQLRRAEITTAYEFLEARFGLSLRLFGSASFIVFQFGRMGIVVLLPALALSAVTEMNVYVCILVIGGLSTLYTCLGGIEAVIWTDVMQAVVLLTGALLAVAMVVVSIDGGLTAIFTQASAAQRLRLIDWTWSPAATGLPVILSAAVFNNLISYTTDQTVIQRYLSTPDIDQSSRAVWINGLMSVPASALFFFVGTCLFVFYQEFPQRLPTLATDDQVFAGFIAYEMPSTLSGFVIAGVFAAAMSSLDSSIHSVATAVTTDFVQRLRPGFSQRQLLLTARGLTLLLGTIGTATALLMADVEVPYLWKLFLDWVGLLGGPLAGLFVLAIFTPQVGWQDAWTGIGGSLCALLTARFSWHVNGLLFGAIGTVSCILSALCCNLLRHKP